MSLQPLDQNQCLVPQLKDLLHICLELETQGHGMIFRVCNLGSKQPHLYNTDIVSVASQLHTTVPKSAIYFFCTPEALIGLEI